MSREGRKIRVLVADDSRSMRLLIRSAFPFGQGLPEFCDASDGKEAVAIYKAQRCDIVLLDIRMPVLNGLAALEEIRAYDEDAFVVMISGECTQENLAAAREAGAKNMVRKPVSQQVVKDILTAYHERERRPVSILAADQSEEIIGALTVGLGILKIRHRMYRADSAAEAERAFQSIHFDLLFIDSHLGDNEGLKLISQIKKARPTTYRVVFTDDSAMESVLNARKHGADDYLLKSVDLVQLVKVWNRFIAASKEEFLTGRRPIPAFE